MSGARNKFSVKQREVVNRQLAEEEMKTVRRCSADHHDKSKTREQKPSDTITFYFQADADSERPNPAEVVGPPASLPLAGSLPTCIEA